MTRIKTIFWAALALVAVLWFAADPAALRVAGFFPLRGAMVQISGLLAMTCMSVAMILALRPRWPERWIGGLDKMYRLHKWLGIGGLVLAIVHWLWAKGPKWAVGFGWLTRPERGPRPAAGSAVEEVLRTWRGTAEGIGEWAFYAAVLLIAVALIHRISYRAFYQTHRWLALAYLVLVFHTVVLMKLPYWSSPLGLVMALLLAYASAAALVVLARRVGARRKVAGTVTQLQYFPELRVLRGDIDIPQGWPGHKPGQFAFVTTGDTDDAHPFTIASAWNPAEPRLTFVTKELGDYTQRLPEVLHIGQPARIEGPYGCFTFEDDCARQIWIGGGIGITPFIARMQQLAMDRQAYVGRPRVQQVDLFHTTADWSEDAIAQLRADAEAAGIRLHVLHDGRDGRLTGERIRQTVPDWQQASIWFCGPAGFGAALRRDFAASGMPVARRFHQELFAMR
ncbi:ferric reductase-like transmembrane domain-containing protein [Oryzisolibacter sp. LB2S]|uniref:ferredoxin reductase family protein n=1 Tax=Alicycliphilus soli TaxID=3228789 RepID=UPI003459F17B